MKFSTLTIYLLMIRNFDFSFHFQTQALYILNDQKDIPKSDLLDSPHLVCD